MKVTLFVEGPFIVLNFSLSVLVVVAVVFVSFDFFFAGGGAEWGGGCFAFNFVQGFLSYILTSIFMYYVRICCL